MRLKQIKLAGFKSFVDPTKVPFEHQMTAIVGPNGCGKSNIIDAVRWVLGESSAKNLRGDAMTDVIFNGAATRKPIGQANVELLFENTSGRLQGSMADRSEVSIKRTVNRDSVNSYFLNGAKCRRKDITDIFLGTGLGPRSYAIIEQGTISRLIESKPQDLRVFIEEAAGISKYKERRRDTENRIRHTRENLARLSDIRAELTLQVDKLHQQAEAAKRFRTLKASERKYKAELTVLRWLQFDQKHTENQQEIKQRQTRVNDLILAKDQQDIAIFQAKQQIDSNSDALVKLQQQKLKLSSDIARLEQNLKHDKQRKLVLLQDADKYLQQVNTATEHIVSDENSLEQVLLLLEETLPQLVIAQEQLDQQQQMSEQFQLQQNQWQLSWDQHNKDQSEYTRKQTLFESNLSAQQVLLTRSQTRQAELIKELEQLEQKNNESLLPEQEQGLLLANESLAQSIQEQQALTEKEQKLQSALSEHHQIIGKQQGLQQALAANLEQLQAQQAEQPDWALEQLNYLQAQNIPGYGALFEHIKVDTGWELAVEQVLSFWLQAQVVDTLPEDITLDSALLVGKLADTETAFLTNTAVSDASDKVSLNVTDSVNPATLAAKITGYNALLPQLNQVFVAENLRQAHEILAGAAPHQSVICKDASWLGHGFLKKGAITSIPEHLQRQQQINKLQAQLEALELELSQAQSKARLVTEKQRSLRQQYQQTSEQVKITREKCQQLQQTLLLTQQQNQHQRQRSELISTDIKQLSVQITNEETELAQLNQQNTALITLCPDENLEHQLRLQQENIQQQMLTVQQKTQGLQQDKHRLALAVEQGKTQSLNLEQNIKRAQSHVLQLQQQQNEIAQQLKSVEHPQEEGQSLQLELEQMSVLEERLMIHTEKQNSALQTISLLEQQQKSTAKEAETLKEQMTKYQLEAESYRLRAEAALEQLIQMQQTLADVRAAMPPQAKESVWQGNIIRLSKDISQLGAINLAAIDEYNSQLERKTFLDLQNDDLTQAITTLESAIEKIDKESRHKFKLTFDQVNQDLKTLFPKVFGGGSAYLDLTGDDLLDTGVSIMARPPGKKNSTIHLLSGGEKALTALSLVFAIFRLNPAPFCMLDEVDAPLDDANVGRFCNLVREMSQTVQFIYISHNKIAMEMASHLTGVTMFEPGVSRMVAVDIDEAMAMAEVS